MNLFLEIKEIKRSILPWFFVLIIFTAFFFFFGLKEVNFLGRDIYFPLPSTDSFSSQIFKTIQQNLLPDGVQLIVTNPLSAFWAQMLVSLSLSLVITLPILFWGIIKYISPALFERERKTILKVLAPFTLLFFSGCVFAYFFLIPLIFKTLYPYTTTIGAIPFFSVNEFITLVFGMAIANGVMFLIPILMVFLSFLGIVNGSFWKDNWRYALLLFLIFSAIITPDGTGVSMLMLSVPLTGLYFIGTVITIRNKGQNKNLNDK
jgi:sec-independent protein translocase protein TatC